MTFLTKKLRQPITAYEEQHSEITLRTPGMAEVNAIKAYPYTLCPDDDGAVEIRIKPVLVSKYIEMLADIPASAVKQIHPADVFEIGNALMGFFTGNSEAAASSD
ncbi:phage tail assembly protein [Chitinibacter sp. S2-10]|uniref:phage tail assembly protein n=1 Tax=Chitinibacter sp. S2-10 TaxID=3373597 RepID=UPI00397729D7